MSNLGEKGDGNAETSGLSIVVSAPGKVILHGEHSVVYGKLALAGSLDLRTTVKLVVTDAPDAFDVELAALGVDVRFDLESIRSLLETPLPVLVASKEYNWETPNLLDHDRLLDRIDDFLDKSKIVLTDANQTTSIRAVLYLCAGIIGSTPAQLEKSLRLIVTTDLTTGAGMGSSASFSVAVATAFLQYVKLQKLETNFSKNLYKPSHWLVDTTKFASKELELICRWAFNSECIIHGTPSGLDNTACTYGSLIEFRKGIAPVLVSMSRPLNLLLIDTKVTRQTKKMVDIAANYKRKFPDIFENVLDSIELVTATALGLYKSLSNMNGEADPSEVYSELSMLFGLNHGLLNALGVGHRRLDEAIGILDEAGLKGKLTGAGGGGYAICLVPPGYEDDALEDVVASLVKRQFDVIRTNLGGKGVRVDN